MKHKKEEILKVFAPFLWSYDVGEMDLERDKKRIVINVLNYGTKEATDLLFVVYNKQEVVDIIKDTAASEWDPKSLNFWSLILHIDLSKQNALRNIG